MRIHPLLAGHGTPARQPLSRSVSSRSDQFFDEDLVESARAQAIRLGGDVDASRSRTQQDQLEALPLARALMSCLGVMTAQRKRNFVLRLNDEVLLTRFGLRGHDGSYNVGQDYGAERVGNAVSTWLPLNGRALARMPDLEAALLAAAGHLRAQAVPVSVPPRDAVPGAPKHAVHGPASQAMSVAFAAIAAEQLAVRRTEAQPRIFARALATTLEPTPLVQALMQSLRALDDAYGARHALHVFGHKRGLYLTASGFRKGRDPVDVWARLRTHRRRSRRQASTLQGVLSWHVRNTRNLNGGVQVEAGGIASARADGRGKYHIDVALEDKSPVFLDWHRHRNADEALRAVESALAVLAGHVEEHAAVTSFGSQCERTVPVEADLLPGDERTSEIAPSLVALAQEEASRLQSLVAARQHAPDDFVAFLSTLEKQPITQAVMKSLEMLGRASGHPVGLHDDDLPVVLTAGGFRTLIQGNGARAPYVHTAWGPYFWTKVGTESLPWFHNLDDAKKRIRTLLAEAAVDVEPVVKPLIGRASIKDRFHVWWER